MQKGSGTADDEAEAPPADDEPVQAEGEEREAEKEGADLVGPHGHLQSSPVLAIQTHNWLCTL